MLSSQHHCPCVLPARTAPCQRPAARARVHVGSGERRCRGGDGELDSARKQPSSVTTPNVSSTSSTVPRRPAAATGVITSPSNPLVKHCVKLRQNASYRRSCGCALVVGLTPIREITNRYRESNGRGESEEGEPCVDRLLLLDCAEATSEASALLLELGINSSCGGDRVVRVSPAVMRKLAGLQSTDSTEAVAVMRIPKCFHDVSGEPREGASSSGWFSSPPHRLLVLDGIQDPGNLGTLLRSAMAFKWDAVFLLPNCCDPFNDKALRAARGASFQLSIVTGDWVHLDDLRNKLKLKMLAAHPENRNEKSKDSFSLKLCQALAESLADTPLCLTLGSEGHGLSEQTMHSSELVHIPMAGRLPHVAKDRHLETIMEGQLMPRNRSSLSGGLNSLVIKGFGSLRRPRRFDSIDASVAFMESCGRK